MFRLIPLRSWALAFCVAVAALPGTAATPASTDSDARLRGLGDAQARMWHAALKALDETGRRNLAAAQDQWIEQLAAVCKLPLRGRPTTEAIAEAAIGDSTACVEDGLETRTAVLQEIALVGQGEYGGGERADRLWDVGPYRLVLRQVHRDDLERDVLIVLRGGTWLHSLDQQHLDVNPRGFFEDVADWEAGRVPFEVGRDVLGLGAPALVVSGFSGGAHCCFDLTVLVLGPAFAAMPTIALRDGDEVRVTRADGHPATITVQDFSFAYWRSSFADSFAPRVVLGYDPVQARYRADPALMADPLAPAEQRTAEAGRAREEHRRMLAAIEAERRAGHAVIDEQVPGSTTTGVLTLIYGGHWNEARAFLAEAWAGGQTARDGYWSELTDCVLRRSQFWPAVAALNQLPAAAPVCQPPP